MHLYSSYHNYDSIFESLTLGNLGYSETHCETFDVQARPEEAMATANFKCKSGVVASVVDFGMTTKYENQQSCSRMTGTQYCNEFLHDKAL